MNDRKDNAFVLMNERLPVLLDVLMSRYRVIGPTQNDKGASFMALKRPEELFLEYRNTVMSPKGFFLPQTESLIKFDPVCKVIERSEQAIRTTIIIGMRPCDALAVSHLDRVFIEEEPQDPYYQRHREAFRIISLACSDPGHACFCTSVGCRPDSEAGADIIMHRLDGRYLMISVTAKGDEILAECTGCVQPAKKGDIEEKKHLVEKSNMSIKISLDIDKFRKKIDDFKASWWEKISQKCLGCGVCTYLCPTCHCFDINDEVGKNHGRRIRTWDSCMYPLFTLHASGHNPRKSQKERMRQRIMHKFNYTYRNYQKIFCVGCGRCTLYCPVNIDIKEIIKQITEVS